MTDFFRDMAVNPFLLSGLIAGLLAGLACGIIGPYVVTRRIVFLGGALAHIAVGGVGAAFFLAYAFPRYCGWLEPLHGALAAALTAAVIINIVTQRAHEQSDTIIGALWAVGMAAGILLIKFTPGYQGELMSYLFGNLAVVPWSRVVWMAILDAVIVVAVLLFHKQFLAVCLDPQMARLQNVHVSRVDLVLLCLTALTVICLTQVVGLILVIALLCLPAAAVARHVTGMGRLIVGSTLLGCVLATLPRIVVYGTPVSPEAAIVLAAGGAYLLSLILAALRR